jgi:long-chain acyl-CoA synthetase
MVINQLHHLAALTDASFVGEALADERVRLDYDGFRAAVIATAARLSDRGVTRGDVVAAVLPNRVELAVAMYATWLIGAALTPVNPALTADEVGYQLADARASIVIVDAETSPLAGHTRKLDVGLVLAPYPSSALTTEPRFDDIALLIYTSGTTGRPKGVRLDHANLSAMTTALHAHIEFSDSDRALLILPLFHVNAIMVSIVAPLAVGGSAVILPRFDARSFWSSVAKERPTYFSAVPAIYLLLASLTIEQSPDTSSLRFAFCGAAPMPPSAITDFETRYGLPLIEGYGLSESTVALTVNPLDGPRKAGTVGLALPGVEVAIMDDAGRLVADGVDGEVVARGATIMRGYLAKPAETAAALVDGWLHTGDVGYFDEDGYLVLVDRKKDLIIRGGENISPSEVEAVLATHPAVHEVAVVGRPDSVMGEEPVAFVMARPGHALDPAQLLEHARVSLAKFKVPKEIRIVEELPHNAVGKILKADLRKTFAAADLTP